MNIQIADDNVILFTLNGLGVEDSVPVLGLPAVSKWRSNERRGFESSIMLSFAQCSLPGACITTAVTPHYLPLVSAPTFKSLRALCL